MCTVSSGGRRIKVHYNDGTNKVADFPKGGDNDDNGGRITTT